MARESDYAQELEKLRIQIDQLKISYERYFLGLDRTAPIRKHDELKALVRKYRAQNPPKNTALRFKLNSLISKFASYNRYWERILREMEEGRFSRDRYKAVKRKINRDMLSTYTPGGAASKASEPVVEPGDATTAETARTSHSRPRVDKRMLEKAYNDLVEARKRTGESVNGLSYDKVMKQFERKLPEFMQKHKCNDVELKVVVKDGKAKIRAIPKK